MTTNKPSSNSASASKQEAEPTMKKLPPSVPSLSKHDAKHKFRIGLKPRKVYVAKEQAAVVTPLKENACDIDSPNAQLLEVDECCFESPTPISCYLPSTASVMCKPEPRRLMVQSVMPEIFFPSSSWSNARSPMMNSFVFRTPIPN